MQADNSGVVLVFTDADVARAGGYNIPQTGWNRMALPTAWPPPIDAASEDAHQTVWARMLFDHARLPPGPLAIYSIDSRERLLIYLNGIDIARNFSSEDDLALGANRPMLVTISRQLLRDGVNELVIRAQRTKQSDVGFGYVTIGSAQALEQSYQRQVLWRSLLQAGASYTMLVLGIMVIVLWILRRQEPELLFLGISGIGWFARNYQFFASRAFEPFGLFRFVSDVSIFIAGGALLCYCVLQLRLPSNGRLITFLVVTSIVSGLAFTMLWGHPAAQVTVIGISLLAVIPVIVKIVRSWDSLVRSHLWSALLVVIVLVAFSVHDVGRMPNMRWWSGTGFQTQPFAGIVLFFVFLIASGRRYVAALGLAEQTNAALAANVAEARRELAASEAARREIEVERAIDGERARLMREMHDGIGSNLVTALAIARQDSESPRTIATLQRALADLKITVDSLAPVDGDLVALLANLRHRMQPDLTEAGLTSIWQAQECPPVPWLDAQNALQMLRIIQEAIGNVLTHADASELSIACAPVALAGRDGVQIELADNGIGFDADAARQANHGLANMHERARTMGGVLKIDSTLGAGTTLRLWLPLVR